MPDFSQSNRRFWAIIASGNLLMAYALHTLGKDAAAALAVWMGAMAGLDAAHTYVKNKRETDHEANK